MIHTEGGTASDKAGVYHLVVVEVETYLHGEDLAAQVVAVD